jgi:hypothetical protein
LRLFHFINTVPHIWNSVVIVERSSRLSRADYEAAVQYLAAALAPHVKVEPVAGASSAARLSAPRRSGVVLRLREWTDAELVKRSSRRGDAIWVLQRAAPELREQLRAAGQSYIDPGGAVRVELPWLLVDRTDLAPMAMPEARSDPFADRSSLVVRTLLSHSTRRSWGIRELAATSGVGLGTASRVAGQLHRLNLIDAAREHGKPGRVRVIDPQRMLDRWTRAYDWTRNELLTVHAPIGDPEAFVAGRQLYDAFRGHRWALTLQAGAAFVVRYAAWERVHVYVDVPDSRELGLIALTNRWTPGDDGGLVLMRSFYRTSLWPSAHDISRGIGSDLWIVSNLQLVLDLWNYPLRGREQAELIRDRVLKPIWDADE